MGGGVAFFHKTPRRSFPSQAGNFREGGATSVGGKRKGSAIAYGGVREKTSVGRGGKDRKLREKKKLQEKESGRAQILLTRG